MAVAIVTADTVGDNGEDMSVANNGPTSPPQGPPPVPPQGPQQPRWAWWVAGIVIPVVGIVVTILMSGSGSSDDKSDETTGPTRSSVSTEPTGQEQPTPSPTKSTAADQVLYGPGEVTADVSEGGAVYIELDTTEPLTAHNTDLKGADIIYQASGDAPGLDVPDSASHLAPLPASDSAPTAEQCIEAVERNGVYAADAKRGADFCLLTGEGRVVHFRVVAAPPGRGIGKLDVTVWETPAA